MSTENEVLQYGLDAGGLSYTTTSGDTETCWRYWTGDWYPNVISTSYPVYIQERSLDKGKQAFEIIKVLKDKKMVKLDKVKDFINLMDALIKIL